MGNLASAIDHTNLKPTATEEDIRRLCNEAVQYNFATVCINGCYVPLCRDLLSQSPVKICTVVGFPLGATLSSAKAIETSFLLDDGADEIDMVINVGFLKSGKPDLVLNDIKAVKNAIDSFNPYRNRPKPLLKVIIETCYLTNDEKKSACELSMKAGADFVKTSTGFGTGGATLENVKLMKSVVGDNCLIKASGGIKDFETASAMIEAGAARLGTSSGVLIVQ